MAILIKSIANIRCTFTIYIWSFDLDTATSLLIIRGQYRPFILWTTNAHSQMSTVHVLSTSSTCWAPMIRKIVTTISNTNINLTLWVRSEWTSSIWFFCYKYAVVKHWSCTQCMTCADECETIDAIQITQMPHKAFAGNRWFNNVLTNLLGILAFIFIGKCTREKMCGFTCNCVLSHSHVWKFAVTTYYTSLNMQFIF